MDGTAAITNLRKERTEEAVPVYNFHVTEWVSYFVSELDVYVHNGGNHKSSRNNRIPPKQVNGGTFNVEVPPARPIGSGVVPGAHNANVRIISSDGKTINVWREVSKNATSSEKALGTKRMRQATHTEQRALTRINLTNETMIITGQKRPCKNCQGAMRKATMNNSAKIIYQWKEGGKTKRTI